MREFLSNLLFGGSCFLCRGAARGILCPACDADLPRLAGTLCPHCGRCLADAPRYDATVAALGHRFPADTPVHALKFRSRLALAALLGDLLLKCIPAGGRVDCVLPVPLSRERLRERGYNQAAEIARHVAKERRARLDSTGAARERNTLAQAGLPWSDRARSVRGAFRCERSLDGAARVVNWVVARTFPPDA